MWDGQETFPDRSADVKDPVRIKKEKKTLGSDKGKNAVKWG